MQYFTSLEEINIENSWLTIGTYDGVHLGHQGIIRPMVIGANNLRIPSVVVTFHPHPAVILRNRKGRFYLTTPAERAEFFGNLGVDNVVIHTFDAEISKLSAVEFISKLKSHIGFSQLWVGHDFALGHNREGNIIRLYQLGEEYHFDLNVVPPVKINNRVISSSMVRNSLENGNVAEAENLLGRPYQLEGRVVPGDGRGKLLGIPTANLEVWNGKTLPKYGVYVCQVEFENRIIGAVTNIGIRPTFDQHKLAVHIETHLLDFEGDLYGKNLRMFFLQRLRDEKKFQNIQELVNQILLDIESAKTILLAHRSVSGE